MRVSILVGAIAVVAMTFSIRVVAQGNRPSSERKGATGTASSLSSDKTESPGWTRKTPWGDPDLQAIWNDSTATPMQRDRKYGTRATFTDEEFAVIMAAAEKVARQRRSETNGAASSTRGLEGGNSIWVEVGKPLRQTSLIIDPPNGRLPPYTPSTAQELAERTRLEKEPRLDSSLWTQFSQQTRCIGRGLPAMMHPTTYNNNYQIIQAPGYVVIFSEMIHEARIIPLDGRPHLNSAIRQWIGDSRGRWEGQTLVVDTINFTADSEPMGRLMGLVSLKGSDAKLTERFTRTSATDMQYQYTLDAPGMFTSSITARIPFSTTVAADRIMEYACIEGDRSMALQIKGLITVAKAKNSLTAGSTPR
jgi:hypothetical protein